MMNEVRTCRTVVIFNPDTKRNEVWYLAKHDGVEFLGHTRDDIYKQIEEYEYERS